jgi:hypothetical protein
MQLKTSLKRIRCDKEQNFLKGILYIYILRKEIVLYNDMTRSIVNISGEYFSLCKTVFEVEIDSIYVLEIIFRL